MKGNIKTASRDAYLEIIHHLYEQGAEAIILGCTEISLLIQQSHTKVPLFDTMEIHAEHAVRWALSE